MQHGPTPPQSDPAPTTTQGDPAAAEPQAHDATETESSTPALDTQPATDPAESATESTPSNALLDIIGGANQDSLLPGLLFMLGVVVALLVVMRGLRRKSSHTKAQTRAMSNPTERIDNLRVNAARSMEPAQRAYVELEDVARRLTASLDNKATRLEILLEQATQRIESLEQTLADQRQPTTPQRPREVTPEDLDRARIELDREERAAQPPMPKPRSAIDELAQKVEHADEPEPIAFQSPYAGPPIQDRVRELATQGCSAAEIASRLDKPIGQIELILNLWRNSG